MPTEAANKGNRSEPRLSLAGPVALGVVVVAGLLAASTAALSIVPIEKGFSLIGTIGPETRARPIHHAGGGVVGKVLVKAGEAVRTGDLLAVLDNAVIDAQIASLNERADAVRTQLGSLRAEASVASEALAWAPLDRWHVQALERQAAALEQEAADHKASITKAEQQLARAEIRSPVAGHVVNIWVEAEGDAIGPAGIVAEIAVPEERVVIEGRMPAALVGHVRAGGRAKVRLPAGAGADTEPLPARVIWVSPEPREDRRTGFAFNEVRVVLDEPRAAVVARLPIAGGERAEVLVLSGERTLFKHLIAPLRRTSSKPGREP